MEVNNRKEFKSVDKIENQCNQCKEFITKESRR